MPAYNGPCQCKACFAIFRRLRSFMFEWGFFGPKEINEQIAKKEQRGEDTSPHYMRSTKVRKTIPSIRERERKEEQLQAK